MTMNITNGFAFLISVTTTSRWYDETRHYEFIDYIPTEEFWDYGEETNEEWVERILREAKILPYISGYEATISMIGQEGYPKIKVKG